MHRTATSGAAAQPGTSAAKAARDTLFAACADPGRFVERRFKPSEYGGASDPEPLYQWQGRAVIAALDTCPKCELHHPWICGECGERL